MGQSPYGYIKDPNNPKRWIVDDEAAQVVWRIYSMTLEGYGTEQIATQLEKDEILTPGDQAARKRQTAARYQVEQFHRDQNPVFAGVLR